MCECITTQAASWKTNRRLCVIPKERRRFFEPSGVIEINGKTLQWCTLFVDRFCLRNAFRRNGCHARGEEMTDMTLPEEENWKRPPATQTHNIVVAHSQLNVPLQHEPFVSHFICIRPPTPRTPSRNPCPRGYAFLYRRPGSSEDTSSPRPST